jgi:hypothetical protein
MNRYIAKLIFNINIDNGENSSQFDEQTRIIEAQSLEDAFFKARLRGKKEESNFINKNNKQVNWEFIDVTELYPLDNAKDGEQLYSKTYENEDASSFINSTRQKSMIIQTFFLSFA